MTYVKRTKEAKKILDEFLQLKRLYDSGACRGSAMIAAKKQLAKEFRKVGVVALEIPKDNFPGCGVIPDPDGGWAQMVQSKTTNHVILCTRSLELVAWLCDITKATPVNGNPQDSGYIYITWPFGRVKLTV